MRKIFCEKCLLLSAVYKTKVLPSGAGTFFRQGGLKIVRSCQRLGGEAPQTPLFSNARF